MMVFALALLVIESDACDAVPGTSIRYERYIIFCQTASDRWGIGGLNTDFAYV